MTEVPPIAKRSLAQEFFDFLKTFGIIGLAIAFAVGQAASKLVNAFVTDFITPLHGTVFTGRRFELNCGYGPKIKLVANIIDFLIIAFIVFIVYKQLSRFKLVVDKTKPAESKQA